MQRSAAGRAAPDSNDHRPECTNPVERALLRAFEMPVPTAHFNMFNVRRVTVVPSARSTCYGAVSVGFLFHGDDAPRALTRLDFADNRLRGYIHHGNIVRGAIGRKKAGLVGREGNPPGAFTHFE